MDFFLGSLCIWKKKQFQYAIQTSLRNKCTFLNELQFCIASNIYSSSHYHLANTEVFRVSVPKSTSTLLIDMFFCPCSKQSFMLCGKWNALIGCNLIWKLHCSWVAFKIWFRYCKRYQSRHVLDAGRPSPFFKLTVSHFKKRYLQFELLQDWATTFGVRPRSNWFLTAQRMIRINHVAALVIRTLKNM